LIKSLQSSVSDYQSVSEKKTPHTKSQSHKENNHRAHREHRESFSARDCPLDNQPAVSPPGFSFFSKPSEKHSCFSEGLLKKETMAEKD
jgi:hypothetical protein